MRCQACDKILTKKDFNLDDQFCKECFGYYNEEKENIFPKNDDIPF